MEKRTKRNPGKSNVQQHSFRGSLFEENAIDYLDYR